MNWTDQNIHILERENIHVSFVTRWIFPHTLFVRIFLFFFLQYEQYFGYVMCVSHLHKQNICQNNWKNALPDFGIYIAKWLLFYLCDSHTISIAGFRYWFQFDTRERRKHFRMPNTLLEFIVEFISIQEVSNMKHNVMHCDVCPNENMHA